MASEAKVGVPTWFWVVAGLAALWEALGCYMYVTQVTMSAEQLAQMPQAQQDIWNAMPGWATAAYAVAVWGGLAGAVGLLMRRSWAKPFFALSLLGIAVQFGWVFLATDIMTTVGASSLGFPLFIFLVALFLLWFSGRAQKRGWLA